MRQSRLPEGVHDTNPIDFPGFLQIFREKDATAGLLGRPQDQSVPEGKPMKAVEVDGSEYVRDLGSRDIELGQQFDFPARNLRINMEFPRDGNEILLQYL
jgi:hypothetical protein